MLREVYSIYLQNKNYIEAKIIFLWVFKVYLIE